MHKIILIFLFLGIYSCSKKTECEKAPDVSHISVDISVKRLEHELFEFEHKKSVMEFINQYKAVSKYFLLSSDYPNDTILAEQLVGMINDPDIQKLYAEATVEFGDLSAIESEYEQAFKYAKYFLPGFRVPEIKSMVTGLGNDLFVSDSLIVIGLDYFIGPKASYRPIDLPQYILSRYQKEYIVPSSILVLSTSFNATNRQDNSVLADMIYYGKAYYFTKQLLPCTPDSLIIGYSAQQMEDVENNQGTIWAHFVDNQLLYETSPFVKSKYLDERPKTPEIGNKAPGRIGNYLGWKIVQQYMAENPGVTLKQLMDINDVQVIFSKSKYKPKNT
jgi:gliding motility-associated lipoprotein GldB